MESSIHLEHAFTYRTAVTGPHEVGKGPFGQRQYYEMIRGVIEGVQLSGRTLGSGADWMLVGSDGFLRMDARIQVLTDDGATLCVRYRGPAEVNARLRQAIASGESTSFSEQRIRTCWEIESGDSRYAWVNQSIFVGEGRFCPAGPAVAGFEHRVYCLA